MRQFFKNSIPIMVFFYSLSISVCIAIALFKSISLQTTEYLEFVGKDAYQINISQLEGESVYKNSEFRDFIISNEILHVVKTSSMSSGVETYWKTNCLKDIKLKSGRLFSKEDMENCEVVALISEELEGDCVNENGRYFYMFDNNKYEVIGIMKNTQIDIIVPLSSALFCFSDSPVNGTFYLDCGEYTYEIIQNLSNEIIKHNKNAIIDYVKIEEQSTSNSAIIDLKAIIIVGCCVVFLMLMNLHNILEHWFNGKKSEISSYRLCGINDIDIWYILIVNYSGITLISSILGLASAVLALNALEIISCVYLIDILLPTLSLSFLIASTGIIYCSFKLRKVLNFS